MLINAIIKGNNRIKMVSIRQKFAVLVKAVKAYSDQKNLENSLKNQVKSRIQTKGDKKRRKSSEILTGLTPDS